MYRSFRHGWLLCLLMLFFVDTNTAQDIGPELTGSLTTTKKEFLLLEPIPIKLKLSVKPSGINVSKIDNKTWQVHLRLQLYDPSATLAWRVQSDKLVNLVKNCQIGEVEVKLQDLFTAEQLRINHSGRYQLTVFITNAQNQRLVAESFQFNVLEPKGNDQQAYQWLKSYQNGVDPLAGSDITESVDANNSLRVFVESFRSTPYGDYAAFHLASGYYRQEKFDLAIPLLLELNKLDDYPLQEEVLAYLIMIYQQLDEPGRAGYYFAQLSEQFPDSEHVKKMTEFSAAEDKEVQAEH